LQDEVLQRDFRRLRSDVQELFDEPGLSEIWWEFGLNAPGQLLTDSVSADHDSYLRMTYGGLPTFRLWRDDFGISMFGEGNDERNYSDTTDLYVTVDMRHTGGKAWLGIRNTRSIAGNNVHGYRMLLSRQDDMNELVIEYRDASTNRVVYQQPIPGTDVEPLGEWVELKIISFEDKIAFFANDRFLTFVDNADALGGTVGLGVEENTTADFDTLIIRDTTPHGE